MDSKREGETDHAWSPLHQALNKAYYKRHVAVWSTAR